MKIISKFKDYYDGGAMYGVDTERIYVRENKTILDSDDYDPSNTFGILGFCGKIYPIVDFSQKGFETSQWDRHPKKYILYNSDAIKYTFEIKKNKSYVNACQDDRYVKVSSKHRYYGIGGREDVYNNLINSKELKKLFIKYKVPVFYIPIHEYRHKSKELILNPKLKDLAFYKIKDTIQAFQEIEMFISNILVSDTYVKIPTGSDNDIRDSKGFDKWTFRKESLTKK